MTRQSPRGNVEMEAWDRELRGDTDAAEEPTPGNTMDQATPLHTLPDEAPPPSPGTRSDVSGSEDPAARTIRTSGAEPSPAGSPPSTPAPGNDPAGSLADEGVTTEILLRDLIIFQVKLLLDGLKDLVLSPLAIAAVLWDLVPSRNAPRGRTFYQIMKVGERFDLWLNLYNPSSAGRQDHEGLLEAGVHSADSLMGKLEQLARAETQKQMGGQGSIRPPLAGKDRRQKDDPGR